MRTRDVLIALACLSLAVAGCNDADSTDKRPSQSEARQMTTPADDGTRTDSKRDKASDTSARQRPHRRNRASQREDAPRETAQATTTKSAQDEGPGSVPRDHPKEGDEGP